LDNFFAGDQVVVTRSLANHYRPCRSFKTCGMPQEQSACVACVSFRHNWCRAAAEWTLPPTARNDFETNSRTVPARRIILRASDVSLLRDVVPVICEGWAASSITLSNGSRQILSFVLPGDLISTSLLFAPGMHCSVEAVTRVRYRTFKRAELKKVLSESPDALERVAKAWLEEKMRADHLIVDLGRCSAEERIARLILNLEQRLAERGMVQAEASEMDFPLRQHHIADAVGLTVVHVSRILLEFRRRGLIKIDGRSLTVLDRAGFHQIASTR